MDLTRNTEERNTLITGAFLLVSFFVDPLSLIHVLPQWFAIALVLDQFSTLHYKHEPDVVHRIDKNITIPGGRCQVFRFRHDYIYIKFLDFVRDNLGNVTE